MRSSGEKSTHVGETKKCVQSVGFAPSHQYQLSSTVVCLRFRTVSHAVARTTKETKE